MGLDNTHLRVLRELDGFTVSLLSVIFEKSWRSGDIREGYKKAKVTRICKKSLKEDPGDSGLLVILQLLEKLLKGSS